MSESDLDDALKDLDPSGDEPDSGGDSEDTSLADDLEAADDSGGGDEGSMELDAELQAALNDEPGGSDSEETAAGDAAGEGMELDAELQAALNDDPGGSGGEEPAAGDAAGEGMDVDAELGMLEESVAAPKAAAAPIDPASYLSGVAGVDEDSVNIEFLLEIKLHVTFEVGRSKMLISDLLTLGQGSVIELHRLVGDELDLLINGKLVARGEVVVINEKFGCRISAIVPPEDRVKYLGGI